MKLFVTIASTVCFLCVSAVVAQQPALQTQPNTPRSGAPPSLPENLVVTLTTAEKEQVVSVFSLVVASSTFQVVFPDSSLNVTSFIGSLTPEEGGTILFTYTLGGQIAVPVPDSSPRAVQSTQYRAISTQSSVRLKLGAPVQIMKSDTRTTQLTISRLSDRPADSK